MIDERFPNWLIDVEKGTIYSLKHKKYIGSVNENGYVYVRKQGYKYCRLHQYIWIVANGCDIPEGYDIHHIDGNPLNNSIYNLELIESFKHRSEHKKGTQLNRKDLSKQITQYTLEGELIKIWDSVMECDRNGYDKGQVSRCCQGKRKTHKGFIWKYYEEQKDVA